MSKTDNRCVDELSEIVVAGMVIRMIRDHYMMSQRDFAKLIGVSREWVVLTEKSDSRRIRQQTLGGIASAMGVPARKAWGILVDLDRLGFRRKEEIGYVIPGPVLRPAIDGDGGANVEPFSERHFVERIPFFEQCVAAGVWVDVTDNEDGGARVTPAQLRQGLFRVRIRGDSMTPRFPDGSVIEFRLLRTPMGVPDFEATTSGECYYVQLVDGRATFKRLDSRDANTLTLRAINKRKYKKPLTCDVADVVRLAAFEWMLSKGE